MSFLKTDEIIHKYLLHIVISVKNLFAAFLTDSNTASNSAFLNTHVYFSQKHEGSYYNFANFETKCGQNGSEKIKHVFNCVLELNFATWHVLGQPDF